MTQLSVGSVTSYDILRTRIAMQNDGYITVGSICSGIEACSVAWKQMNYSIRWLSEISPFPCKLLSLKYPEIPNLGDMNDIPEKILNGTIESPDVICGGTPCQAFSLAGWKKGLGDDRGNLGAVLDKS